MSRIIETPDGLRWKCTRGSTDPKKYINLEQAQKLMADLHSIDASYSLIARCLLKHSLIDEVCRLHIEHIDRDKEGIHYNNRAVFVPYPDVFLEELDQYILNTQALREGSDNIFINSYGRPINKSTFYKDLRALSLNFTAVRKIQPRYFRDMWMSLWNSFTEDRDCMGVGSPTVGVAELIYKHLGRDNPYMRKAIADSGSFSYNTSAIAVCKKIDPLINELGRIIASDSLGLIIPLWINSLTDVNSIKFYPGYINEFLDVGGIINKSPGADYYTIDEFSKQDWRWVEEGIKNYNMWRGNGVNRGLSRSLCYKNLRWYLNKITYGWFMGITGI